MQRVCDGHEIGLSQEHERGAMVGGELVRADRMLDNHLAIGRPPEETGTEAAEGGLVVGEHASRSPRRVSSSFAV